MATSKAHEKKCSEAEAAIDKVMSDTSVGRMDTVASLKTLREHIEHCISSLEMELDDEECDE